jgi:TolB-like protein/DNA-binding winged helix-turn-helix (wHTH) protein
MEVNGKANGNYYRFDDVVVERDNFRVLKGGESKQLTPRAFDVLIYLIERRGRVVEKQELFEAIWKEIFVTDNALMRAVKEIRRELGDDANAPRYVETVHKRGYRFIAEVAENTETNAFSNGNSADKFQISDYKLQISNAETTDTETERQIPNAVTKPPIQNPKSKIQNRRYLFAAAVAVLVVSALVFWYFSGRRSVRQIESIAVLPFVNESGDAEIEYLSDGMTESLIGALSQLPNLKVKAHSSVFRYKGKEASVQMVGKELNVQAVLTGRVVGRGEDLTLYLALVDAATEDNLWSRQYTRKMTNLITLQSEVARDVAANLRMKLSGADERKLTRNYTENTQAYQLYLKGRYYFLKTTPAANQTAISYFEQAIALDSSYAMAYAGLANVYPAHALGSETTPTEVFPKAKAAQKAIALDDQLPEAHAVLGMVSFWYDWDARQADAHIYYAALLALTGRGPEAIDEARRATELDPLNLRTNTFEGQYLVQSGRVDEGLDKLLKTIELEPNFYLAHQFAANAYIEKGMYREAVEEARRAKELSGGAPTIPMSFLGYALAKSGKTAEARAVLNELLKMSESRYVSPFVLALIHNALDERDETYRWLERGIEIRDPRMVLLKFEPKWNNLRGDPKFQEIVRRVGI